MMSSQLWLMVLVCVAQLTLNVWSAPAAAWRKDDHKATRREAQATRCVTSKENGTVSCFFSENLAVTLDDFVVQYYPGPHATAEIVLTCMWTELSVLDCRIRSGYRFDKRVTSQLTLQVPPETITSSTRYVCEVLLKSQTHHGNTSIECCPVNNTKQSPESPQNIKNSSSDTVNIVADDDQRLTVVIGSAAVGIAVLIVGLLVSITIIKYCCKFEFEFVGNNWIHEHIKCPCCSRLETVASTEPNVPNVENGSSVTFNHQTHDGGQVFTPPNYSQVFGHNMAGADEVGSAPGSSNHQQNQQDDIDGGEHNPGLSHRSGSLPPNYSAVLPIEMLETVASTEPNVPNVDNGSSVTFNHQTHDGGQAYTPPNYSQVFGHNIAAGETIPLQAHDVLQEDTTTESDPLLTEVPSTGLMDSEDSVKWIV